MLATLLFFMLNSSSILDEEAETQATEPGAFAVVELFTSQGCSSCPPADRLLSSLLAEAEKEGKNIFPLSFHVDYWNRLGWRDPYSSSDFSKRQRRYATALSSGVYAPQMVFKGREECVGSNRYKAQAMINKVMKRQASTH